MSIHTEIKAQDIQFEVQGYVMSTPTSRIALHGRFASHTGYRSFAGSPQSMEQLRANCEAEAALPFLVWKEHSEFGWKEIRRCYKSDLLGVRLPNWTAKCLTDVMSEIGFHLTDKWNHDWFYDDPKMTEPLLREILAPLRAKGSRATPEDQLADAVRSAFQRSSFKASSDQFSLF